MNNEGIINEVNDNHNGDNYNSELTGNNGVVESGASKNDTVNNISDNENIMGVEVSGVVISVDELEKKWRDSLRENRVQSVNFPRVICAVKASQVLLEDKSSSLGDEWSQKGPLSFCVSGKARWLSLIHI